jgi:lysophospholipase L1-like esterase
MDKTRKHSLNTIVNSLLLLLFSLSMSACSDGPKMQPITADATILAFGDSLTYGTGTSRDKAYPAVLETLINRKVINAGVPGEMTREGLVRLPQLLSRHQPDLLILCHGGNDILRKLDMAKAKNNIQQMIDLAREQQVQVILIGVPEFGLFLDPAPIYQEIADENNLPILPDALSDILSSAQLKSDHIHPNSKGYQQLAESISEMLVQSKAVAAY